MAAAADVWGYQRKTQNTGTGCDASELYSQWVIYTENRNGWRGATEPKFGKLKPNMNLKLNPRNQQADQKERRGDREEGQHGA